MAVPKRKTSKQRRNSRSANWKLAAPNLVECPQCKALMQSHVACKSCGYYDGKVAVVKTEKKKD